MLTASGVSYEYSSGTPFATRALDRVDASVGVGEVLLVAGETGSGKTTLLRVLAGLLRPTEGCAQVVLPGAEPVPPEPAGQDPSTRVGLVFQRAEAQLFGDTVLEDVAFGPRNLGADDPEAEEAARSALLQVGLPPDEYAGRSPFLLSGGEGRRVALAGVLAMEPRYLLLDEPTAGLDAEGRAAVTDAILSRRDERGTVVVTHDLDEYLEHADAVLVLREGRTLFWGSVDEFMDAAASGASDLPVPAVVEAQARCISAGLALKRIESRPESAAGNMLEALRERG